MSGRVVTIDLSEWRLRLRILWTPSCWLQNHEYSGEWDRELRALLRDHSFTDIGTFTARLGGVLIWICNHPYASMHPTGLGFPFDGRDVERKVHARRSTILYAGDRLKQDAAATRKVGVQ